MLLQKRNTSFYTEEIAMGVEHSLPPLLIYYWPKVIVKVYFSQIAKKN